MEMCVESIDGIVVKKRTRSVPWGTLAWFGAVVQRAFR